MYRLTVICWNPPRRTKPGDVIHSSAFDPKMEITCVDGEMKIGNLKLKTEHPSDYLRQILADYKSPRFDYLPPFTGGLVGYFFI